MVQITKVCLVCSKLLKNEESVPINEEIESKLSNLSNKLHPNIKKNSVICFECLEIIDGAYDFKMRCFETEEHLAPHFSENEEIDLKFITEDDNHQEEVLEVCRLCFNPLDEQSCSPLKSLMETDANVKKIFLEYIPNMNFVATRKPMVCAGCQKSIIKFINLVFLLENYGNEKHIKKEENDTYVENEIMENDPQMIENDSKKPDNNPEVKCKDYEMIDNIENEDVYKTINLDMEEEGEDEEIDDEDNESFVEEIAIEIIPSEMEELAQNSEIDESISKHATNQGNIKKSLKSKRTKKVDSDMEFVEDETDDSDNHSKPIKRFKCDICERSIRTKKYLTEHKKSHRHLENCPNYQEGTFLGTCDFCEDQKKVYMCEFCGYRTKVPCNFKVHLQSHHPVENRDQVFECYLCDFKTAVKTYLSKHIRRMHCDPSEIVWFKCPFCDYQTKDKFFLSRHILVMHEEMDEKDMLKCDKCSFITKVKDSLRKHMIIKHPDSSEQKTYQCEFCNYKTQFSIYLSRHKKNKHTDPTQLKPYVCKHCNLPFKYTQTLRNHILLKHKNVKEVYKCDLCDFKAQLPRYVRKHYIRIHENPKRRTKARKAVIHVITKKKDSN